MTLKEFKHQFIVVENIPIVKKGTIEHAPIIIERVKDCQVHYWDGLNWQKDLWSNFELKNACVFHYDHDKDHNGNILWSTKAEMDWQRKMYIDEKVKELYQIYITP
jgi:hypothetical protein